jgi:hypothetical protein
MRTKEEMFDELADSSLYKDLITIEVQIDIRDQLTRIADSLQSQIEEIEEMPGFEGTREDLDKINIR